jgi:6-phosphogluconolactonase
MGFQRFGKINRARPEEPVFQNQLKSRLAADKEKKVNISLVLVQYESILRKAADMVSSDRITTYIGTYTRRESFVDGKAEGIYIYHLDLSSGELTYAATVAGAGTFNPSFLILGPDRSCLYAGNEFYKSGGQNGTISAFAIDPVTGQLSYLNEQSTHGLAPCYASIDPAGRYCLVANYETGSLCVLPILKDGSPGRGNRYS